MSGLLDTPEGFVWMFDRATLGALPADEASRWRDFHEDVWERLMSDPEVHDGCAPADELRAAEREVEKLTAAADEARVEGYKAALADVLERARKMEPTLVNAPPFYVEGFHAARVRMIEGVHRLHERGPKTEETTG